MKVWCPACGRARSVLVFALAASVLAAGCGGEGEAAPQVELPTAQCPTLDGYLDSVLKAVRAGETPRVAAAFTAMSSERSDAADGFMTGLLALLAEAWNGGLGDNPEVLSPLEGLLEGVGPLLGAVMRYLSQDGVVQTEALELVGEILVTCPSGTLSEVLVGAIERPRLLRAFANVLADPLVGSIMDALPADNDQPNGAEGFVALIRTVVRAVNSPNFVFADLVSLLGAVGLPTDEGAIASLLTELQPLLVGENLETMRRLTVCLDQDIVVGASPGHTGSEAMGALLYGLLTDPEVRLGERLGPLLPAVSLLEEPALVAIIEAVLRRLADDSAVRDGLKPALRYLLEPTRARGVFFDMATLVEAGALPELLAAVTTIIGECKPGQPGAP